MDRICATVALLARLADAFPRALSGCFRRDVVRVWAMSLGRSAEWTSLLADGVATVNRVCRRPRLAKTFESSVSLLDA